MNCDQFQHNLDPYLDGELDTALSQALDSHSAVCNSCSALRTRKEELPQAPRVGKMRLVASTRSWRRR